MRQWCNSLAKWTSRGSRHTTAYKDIYKSLCNFTDVEQGHLAEALTLFQECEQDKLRLDCEIVFFLADLDAARTTSTTFLEVLDVTVAKAREREWCKAKDGYVEALAINLRGGAGVAHKTTNVDNALPPLRLTLRTGAGSDVNSGRGIRVLVRVVRIV